MTSPEPSIPSGTHPGNTTLSSHSLREQYDKSYFDGFGQKGADERIEKFAMFTEKYKALAAARIRPHETVLDLGCGRGDMVFHLAHRCDSVYGLDFSDAALSLAGSLLAGCPDHIRNKTKLVSGSALDIPLPNQLFDTVFFLDVIEHLNSDEQTTVLNEIYRVLKPGGKVVVVTPLAGLPPLIIRAYWRLTQPSKLAEAHVNAYVDKNEPLHIGLVGKTDLRNILRVAGFQSKISTITSFWQDSRTDWPAWKRWMRYKLLVRLFGTKLLAIGKKP